MIARKKSCSATKNNKKPPQETLTPLDHSWIQHVAGMWFKQEMTLQEALGARFFSILAMVHLEESSHKGREVFLKRWGELVRETGTKEQVLEYEMYLAVQEKSHGY